MIGIYAIVGILEIIFAFRFRDSEIIFAFRLNGAAAWEAEYRLPTRLKTATI
jgi:hypothetical protein